MEEATKYLDAHGIVYVLHSHPAVFTVEEAEKVAGMIPGISCKNLFLCNDKKTRFILYTLPAFKQISLKDFASKIGEKRLSFCNENLLLHYLGVTPGSVSPLGLINDADVKVEFVLDNDVWGCESLNVHPNDNKYSLELTQENFRKYLKTLRNPLQIV